MDIALDLIVAFVLGIWIGYRINERIHQAVLPDLLRRLGVTPKQLETVMSDLKKETGSEEPAQTESAVIEIKVERHGDTIYVFRKTDDQFLGQGKTFEEIVKRLEKDFQNVKFHVSKEDGADLLKNPTS